MSRVFLGVSLVLLFFFAYLTAIRPAFALAYAFGILFVVAWAWPRVAMRGVDLRRTLDAGTPTVGESFEETFTLQKQSWVPAPWVEVRDMSSLAGYQPGRVITLGKDRVTWTSRGTYRQRGWTTFGPTRVKVSEPFGLFTEEARYNDRNKVLVYPRVRTLPELLMPAAQHAGTAQRFGNWADYPPETGGVRDYTPGDSFGRIHWPLSTKHGRLMSKTFEQPLTADIWIVLDLDRKVHHGTGEESTLEYAVSLAASIALHIHQRGRKVGLIANDAKGSLLEPHRAVRQDRVILDYLAIAQPDSDTDLASALSWEKIRRLPRRAIAVITPSPSPGWVSTLQAVRGRGTALIAFYIDASTFGGPDQTLSFDLGSDVDLYVVRQGDDFSRLMRTRDAVRIS
jgi:uncharacterized protein (DUF58 family)